MDPVSIELTDNGKIDLQASARGITLSADAPASVLAAVAENRPFTAAATVAEGKLTAQGDGDFVFDGGGGKVTFQGEARAGRAEATRAAAGPGSSGRPRAGRRG